MTYGEHQVLINLIDKKGSQQMLGKVFQGLVEGLAMDKVRYIWFDFHKECARMQWQHLARLIDMLQSDFPV